MEWTGNVGHGVGSFGFVPSRRVECCWPYYIYLYLCSTTTVLAGWYTGTTPNIQMCPVSPSVALPCGRTDNLLPLITFSFSPGHESSSIRMQFQRLFLANRRSMPAFCGCFGAGGKSEGYYVPTALLF